MEEHFLKKSHKSITGPSRAEHDKDKIFTSKTITYTHPKSFKMTEQTKKLH